MLNLPVPNFELSATSGIRFRPEQSAGKTLVLYFYPKDATPGCTIEAQQFRDLHPEFRAAGAEVYGISRDSIKSHENFKAKHALPFELISDPEETACALFDVIRMKNLYGKTVRSVERSTFVIDAQGIVRKEWRGVKANGHAREVLDFVKTLG
jgi:peroxiredoxin Q/BCP